METVGRLARRFGLSRSTLLYYDAIGLLTPSGRSGGDYRLYDASDAERLERICRYRRAGLALKDIAWLLKSPETRLSQALTRRLAELDAERAALNAQRELVVKLLANGCPPEADAPMDQATWTGLLCAAGFSEADMRRWHARFERADPDKHRRFLEFLCIPAEEIADILAQARRADTP